MNQKRTMTIVVVAGLFLSACSDPMANVARLSEVELADTPTAVEALPAPEETNEEVGFFQRLMRKREVPADVAAPTEVTTPEPVTTTDTASTEAAVAEAAAPKKPRGMFGFLRPTPKAPTEVASVGPATPLVEPAAATAAAPVAESAVTEASVRAKPRGIFGFLRKGPSPAETADAPVELASAESAAVAKPVETAKTDQAAPKAGLFGASRPSAAKSDVAYGMVLPFGKVGTLCGQPTSALGRKVAQYPEKRAKYKMYDSAPGNTAPHTFYLTGFDDKCVRQFTAALALFGHPEMHEELRYGRPAKTQPYSSTDKAYEKVKSKLCRVSKNKPCGAKMSTLEKTTVFVSVYERFESSAGWGNLLVSDGQLLATDLKRK